MDAVENIIKALAKVKGSFAPFAVAMDRRKTEGISPETPEFWAEAEPQDYEFLKIAQTGFGRVLGVFPELFQAADGTGLGSEMSVIHVFYRLEMEIRARGGK